jgi:hypothetical protein
MAITTSSITLADGSIRLRKIQTPDESLEDRLKRQAIDLSKAIETYESSEKALIERTRAWELASRDEEQALNSLHSSQEQIERVCTLAKHAKLALSAQDASTEKVASDLDSAVEQFHQGLAEYHRIALESTREIIRKEIRRAARWSTGVPPMANGMLENLVKWSVPCMELSSLAPPELNIIVGHPGYFRRGSRKAVPLARRLLESYRAMLDLEV